MSDKQPRPEHAEIQQWTDKRDEMKALVSSLGLEFTFRVIGYSASFAGRQVAVFDITPSGDFRWGWVEHISGSGRTDYYTQEHWVEALAHVHNLRKA